MATIRQEKVGNLVRQELSTIFQQGARAHYLGAMISVTIVRMSPDLGVANVYLSIFGAGNKAEVMQLVQQRTSLIRREVGNKIRHQLRVVPQFKFFIDDSLDYADRIDDLLKS